MRFEKRIQMFLPSPAADVALVGGREWSRVVHLDTNEIGPEVKHVHDENTKWAWSSDGARLLAADKATSTLEIFDGSTLKSTKKWKPKLKPDEFLGPRLASPSMSPFFVVGVGDEVQRIDFEHPSARGLSFDDLERLVTGLTSRRRLMLIDTCAAGETDEDEVARTSSPPPLEAGARVATRGFRLNRKATALDADQDLAATRSLFASLRRGSGAHIIGSSAGVEVAFESSALKNGLFTAAVLEELARKVGKKDAQELRVSTLRNDVSTRVEKVSGGLQHPIARDSNDDADFVVWLSPR
jgi:hypothetical protein